MMSSVALFLGQFVTGVMPISVAQHFHASTIFFFARIVQQWRRIQGDGHWTGWLRISEPNEKYRS